MKRIVYLFPVILFFTHCGKPVSISSGQQDSVNIFCIYTTSPDGLGGSCLQLYKDSSYNFYSSMCVGSVKDSGRFTLDHDTLRLNSVMASKVDTSNHGFGQIDPLTGKKYLLRNGHIYFLDEKGKYDPSYFWLSENSEILPHEVLDSAGNGHADLYRGNWQWTQRGEFKNWQLYDGMKYEYDDSGLKMLEIYQDGVKIKDSLIERN